MLIWKYFKPAQKDVILPHSHGPLRIEVTTGVIKAANHRISEAIHLDPVEAQAIRGDCILN